MEETTYHIAAKDPRNDRVYYWHFKDGICRETVLILSPPDPRDADFYLMLIGLFDEKATRIDDSFGTKLWFGEYKGQKTLIRMITDTKSPHISYLVFNLLPV